jgi:ribose transport system substrate-binding protein
MYRLNLLWLIPIRNIIMDTKNPPDVLICLTAVDTLCAYQAIVDYNKVGQIEIIGYYDSDLILSAIDKEIIHSTMAINAEQMGAYCVQALSEYRETKHVSNYFTVDINIINEKNVQKYINAREKSVK